MDEDQVVHKGGFKPEPRKRRDGDLLRNIKGNLPKLEKLLERITDHWVYEDKVYRFYHHSFKVFHLRDYTKEIITALKDLLPGAEINPMFELIFEQGTAKGFNQKTTNWNWMSETRPILEAFFHAKYFLEQAVRYGKELDEAPHSLPSGWAGLLYLYMER